MIFSFLWLIIWVGISRVLPILPRHFRRVFVPNIFHENEKESETNENDQTCRQIVTSLTTSRVSVNIQISKQIIPKYEPFYKWGNIFLICETVQLFLPRNLLFYKLTPRFGFCFCYFIAHQDVYKQLWGK
jgi:hypothetical protein